MADGGREVVWENISQLQYKPTLLKLLYSEVIYTITQTYLCEQYVSESLRAYACLNVLRKFITQFINIFPYIQ